MPIDLRVNKESGCLIIRSKGSSPAADFYTVEDAKELIENLPSAIEELKILLKEKSEAKIQEYAENIVDLQNKISELEVKIKKES